MVACRTVVTALFLEQVDEISNHFFLLKKKKKKENNWKITPIPQYSSIFSPNIYCLKN